MKFELEWSRPKTRFFIRSLFTQFISTNISWDSTVGKTAQMVSDPGESYEEKGRKGASSEVGKATKMAYAGTMKFLILKITRTMILKNWCITELCERLKQAQNSMLLEEACASVFLIGSPNNSLHNFEEPVHPNVWARQGRETPTQFKKQLDFEPVAI